MPTTTEPTAKQSETLSHIKGYIAKHGYSPTVAELATLAGIHDNALQVRLQGLQRKRLITRTPSTPRSIRPTE